jgi:hypothetical protein
MMAGVTFGPSFLPELREFLLSSGEEVTATIDASDFPHLRRNSSRTQAWNGSDHYHDMAVQASVLTQEQILTYDPDAVRDHVRIQPTHRA